MVLTLLLGSRRRADCVFTPRLTGRDLLLFSRVGDALGPPTPFALHCSAIWGSTFILKESKMQFFFSFLVSMLTDLLLPFVLPAGDIESVRENSGESPCRLLFM